MTGIAARVRERLRVLENALGRPARYLVAFSGGLDSTVLLDLLAGSADARLPVIALHVDHQLHPDSASWAEHAVRVARSFGVDCRVLAVRPDTAAGRGTEAAAREARYAALGGCLEPGDWLLSGHHEDDQVETLLLNLLRGSGPDGLAAMPEARPFAGGWLVRPMLGVSRAELERHAEVERLDWIEDPSNAERGYDRNYLRHEVLPVIGARWPDAGMRLRRSIERNSVGRISVRPPARAGRSRSTAWPGCPRRASGMRCGSPSGPPGCRCPHATSSSP